MYILFLKNISFVGFGSAHMHDALISIYMILRSVYYRVTWSTYHDELEHTSSTRFFGYLEAHFATRLN